jgi:osmotically-inducible protein OsmY
VLLGARNKTDAGSEASCGSDSTATSAMSASNARRVLTLICLGASALAACASHSKGNGNEDSQITADVRTLFAHYPVLEPPNLIDIQTLHRIVYLYGTVDTELQRQLAEAVASQARGATKVVNAIGISGIR